MHLIRLRYRNQKNLSPRELKVISHFTDHVEIIHSTTPICREAATLRRAYGLKTPDAIIASTAICLQLPLITADQRFYSLAELQCIRYQPA
ncbi:MAG: PIN domain-containing protein [Bacteroidota bacterium]